VDLERQRRLRLEREALGLGGRDAVRRDARPPDELEPRIGRQLQDRLEHQIPRLRRPAPEGLDQPCALLPLDPSDGDRLGDPGRVERSETLDAAGIGQRVDAQDEALIQRDREAARIGMDLENRRTTGVEGEGSTPLDPRAGDRSEVGREREGAAEPRRQVPREVVDPFPRRRPTRAARLAAAIDAEGVDQSPRIAEGHHLRVEARDDLADALREAFGREGLDPGRGDRPAGAPDPDESEEEDETRDEGANGTGAHGILR
jgi:hypothetical protein